MTRRPWTEEEISQLEEMYKNKLEVADISKELDRTEMAIKGAVKKFGISKKYPRSKAIDMTGKKYGRLTVLCRGENQIYNSCNQKAQWWVQCDCGSEPFLATGHALRSGHVRSCGCLARDLTRIRNAANRTQNQYIIDEENNIAVGITASGIKFAVDLEDLDKIQKYKWNMTQDGYIQSHDFDKERTTIRLNRIIMGVQGKDWINTQVDHVNHITEDNRKCNLRIANASENQRNKMFDCVNFHKATGKWQARVTFNGQKQYLGLYDTKEKGLEAVQNYKKKFNDEFTYEESMKIAEKNGYIDFDKYKFN